MRIPICTPTAPTVLLLFTAALAGCSPDGAGNPLVPSAPLAAARTSADAATKVKRIHGTLEAFESGTPQPGNPIVVRHLQGNGTASHLGRFTVVADVTLNLVTASGTGTGTYTAANGDVLTTTATGRAVIAAGIATVTEAVTITGGTGRFAGATGSLTVVRRVVQATGVSTGTLDGEITLPR